jgi:hypothetical protein
VQVAKFPDRCATIRTKHAQYLPQGEFVRFPPPNHAMFQSWKMLNIAHVEYIRVTVSVSGIPWRFLYSCVHN